MNIFDPGPYFANLWVLTVIFLPIYHFTSRVFLREILLTSMGGLLLFYAVPRLVPLYLIFWVVVFVAHRSVLRAREHHRAGVVLAAAILSILAPMVLWKIDPPLFQTRLMFVGQDLLNASFPILGDVDAHRNIFVPIGLSVATFRALDLIIQTFLFGVERQSFLRVMAYGFCPFVMPVGPITLFQEFAPERRVTNDDILHGGFRIIAGLGKIYVLAALLEPWGGIFLNYDRPGWQIIIAIYVFAFYFYFNFAGYSDLAIGSGRLFGMRLPENFRSPLTASESPQAFWSRWHASLSRFAQRYVFASLGGVRPRRRPFALFCTIMVIALWHEFSWSYVLFGLYHGSALLVHNYWSGHRPLWAEERKSSWPYKISSRVLLCTFVAFGFPIIMLAPAELVDFYVRIFAW